MGKDNIIFEIIVGTYEEFVLGYRLTHDGDNKKVRLEQVFATHSHRASVRSVACCGKLVVSGGADETINIYNMFTRKECGMLMEHDGTITSLSFTPDCSHVISTSEDGSIKVFRQGSWQLEKSWSAAHKGTAVTCLAVHPSGKMALSVGKDHTLRTWNLVKGRPAYTTNLFSRCQQLEQVVWAPGGVLFAIPMDSKVEITNVEKGGVIHTLQLKSKVTSCLFASDSVLCAGEASGEVSAHSTASGCEVWRLPGKERVRGLAYLDNHLVTATSTGRISVYRLADDSSPPVQVASADAGCRITCIALFDYNSEIKVKKEPTDEEVQSKELKQDCTGKNKINKQKSGSKEELKDKKRKQIAEDNNEDSEHNVIKKQKILNGATKKTKLGNNQTFKTKSNKITVNQTKQNNKNKKSQQNKTIHTTRGQKWVVEDTIS